MVRTTSFSFSKNRRAKGSGTSTAEGSALLGPVLGTQSVACVQKYAEVRTSLKAMTSVEKESVGLFLGDESSRVSTLERFWLEAYFRQV